MKKILCLLSVIVLLSCGSSSEEPSRPDNFNRQEMLTFWADDVIIPAYTDFSNKINSLNDATIAFTTSPSIQTLTTVRSEWKAAYVSWQKVSLFQIGKAEQVNMTGNINTYPTDVVALKQYVMNENYNLESPNLDKVQGLPALDYLLNGQGTAQETINFYANATNIKYVKYLKDISSRINNLTTQVLDNWKTSFRTEFINNDGYTAASSVDKLVNFYVIPFYEKQFRENKIATPTGARTGIPISSNVEGYYAKNVSKELYITTLTTAKNFFNGTGFNGTKGKSLQQYLEFLNRKDLADGINAKFTSIETISNTLDDSFIDQIATDRIKMLHTFDAIQALLKTFKPDMMSAMSIMNTSRDIDND